MTTAYQLGPDLPDAIWFEEKINPTSVMADIAVADYLGAVQPSAFAGGATPTTQWAALPYEDEPSFKQRIAAALIGSGSRGVAVTVFSRSGFFQRNLNGTLLSPG